MIESTMRYPNGIESAIHALQTKLGVLEKKIAKSDKIDTLQEKLRVAAFSLHDLHKLKFHECNCEICGIVDEMSKTQ